MVWFYLNYGERSRIFSGIKIHPALLRLSAIIAEHLSLANCECSLYKRSQLFQPLAQGKAFYPRRVRLQCRSFVRRNPRLTHSPSSSMTR
ncbi:MAG: hypothetical protein DME65_00530 [Verrucomicrobia bacterium]|nr:MAG: hypothetical protein DME65_00530 [Verrucomicrobiota bacterium]